MPLFFHTVPTTTGAFIIGQASLFQVYISPCPVLSATMSQLFTPHDHHKLLLPWSCFSAEERL